MMDGFDVAIIGGGIAGASLAAELSAHCSVVVLEAESQPGYHSTGRSNALWHETYGGPKVQPLTTASRAPLALGGFLTPRPTLTIGTAEDEAALAEFESDFAGTLDSLERVGLESLSAMIPGLRPEWDRAVLESGNADIDVAGLQALCLKQLKANGGTIRCNARVEGLARAKEGWRIKTRAGEIYARLVVNAAGGWANEIAELAGAQALHIQPYRRTLVQLQLQEPIPHDLPMLIGINGDFYFRPEGESRVWLSPHDETLTPPCDASPEELDVAIAIDRFETVVDWKIARVEHKWAGLRSFAPDRLPVFGFDPQVEGFFWCAGHGGFGIQTAPAAAKLCAASILGNAPDPLVAHIDAVAYSPARFIA